MPRELYQLVPTTADDAQYQAKRRPLQLTTHVFAGKNVRWTFLQNLEVYSAAHKTI